MNPQKDIRTSIPNSLPLVGKTILITRPKDQATEFAQILQDRGARVLFVPTIQIVPPASWDQCDSALHALDSYDGFIFTSSNAVKYFFQRLDDVGKSTTRPRLTKLTFYAVGTGTKDALVREGMLPTLFSDVANARELADALLQKPLAGRRFLFPKGNLASEELPDILRAAGAELDEVTVYENIAPRNEDAKFIRESFERESIDVVTFFSASSVKHLVSIVPRELLSPRTVAVIGNSTAAAVEDCGLRSAIIAPKPTAADLADAIVQFFSSHQVSL